MPKYSVFFFLILVCGWTAAQGGSLHQVLSQDAQGFEVEIRFPAPRFMDLEAEGETYTQVSMRDAFSRSMPGEPALPSYGIPFSLPPGTRADFTLQVLEQRSLSGHIPLPVPETSFQGDQVFPTATETYRPDMAVYSQPGLFPREQAFLTSPDEWRFHQVQSLIVNPLRTVLGSGNYQWLKTVRVTVRFVPTGEETRFQPAPPEGRAWESLAKRVLVNGDTASRNRSRPGAGVLAAMGAEAPGEAIRLQVGSSGLVRLPFETLQAAGLGEGIEVADLGVEERFFQPAKISTNPYVVTPIPRVIEDANQDGVFGAGDFLVFYGENFRDRFTPLPSKERYSRFHVYWVTTEGGAKVLGSVPSLTDPVDVSVESFKSTVRAEEDKVYTHVPNEVGASFLPTHTSLFWRDPRGDPVTAILNTPAPDPLGEVRFTGYWRGNFVAGDFKAHLESIIFNGQRILDRRQFFDVNDLNWASEAFSNASLLRNGRNVFEAVGERLTADGYRFGSGAYFDHIQAVYDRILWAEDNALLFNSQGASGVAEFSISGFSHADIWVLDITDHRNVFRVEAQVSEENGIYTATMVQNVSGAPHRYFAVVPGSFEGLPQTPYSLSPDLEHIEMIAPGAPIDLDEAGRNSDYIIVTHPLFREAMDRLAEHRSAQGHKTFVCEIQDVYDQFAGGHKTPEAIKSLLRLAYQTWETPPTYLVLGGDGNEDYRAETPYSATDWIPTLIITAWVPGSLGVREVAGSDPWYGQGLGEGEGIATVAPDVFVGRLPVNTSDQADRLVTKIIRYETSDSNSWRNRGVFQADDQYSQGITINSTYCYWSAELTFNTTTQEILDRIVSEGKYDSFNAVPFFQSAHLDTVPELGRTLQDKNCPNLLQTRQYVDRTLSAVLLDTLEAGGLIWTFTGHANATLMTTEAIMHAQDEVPKLNNLGKPYSFMGFACHMAEFERAFEKKGRCFGEALLELDNRGAVAAFASTGFEWLHTNGPSQIVTTAPLFWDVARDPITGKQRRVIGEAFFTGLYNLFLATPNVSHFNLNRTYTLLGDPAMTMDMVLPEMVVELNGNPVQSGIPLTAGAFGDTLAFRVSITEDVDVKSILASRGGVVADTSEVTLTLLSESQSGRQEYELLYRTTLVLGNSDIVVETTDWVGGTSRFEMPAHVDMEFRADGDLFVPGGEELIELGTVIEVLVSTPAPLPANAFSATIDGLDTPVNPVAVDGERRTWRISFSEEWPVGPSTLALTITLGEVSLETQVLLRVPVEELDLESVAFYPNPLEGSEGTLIYHLTNSSEDVELQIYSVRGRKVFSRNSLPGRPGWNYFPWEGRDSLGDPVANGVYLAVLKVGSDIRHLERIVVSR